MHMSRHSMGSIPCQEAYLGLEAQKHYSTLDILLATQIRFWGEEILPYIVLVSLSQRSGEHKRPYYVFFHKLCSRTRSYFFPLAKYAQKCGNDHFSCILNVAKYLLTYYVCVLFIYKQNSCDSRVQPKVYLRAGFRKACLFQESMPLFPLGKEECCNSQKLPEIKHLISFTQSLIRLYF